MIRRALLLAILAGVFAPPACAEATTVSEPVAGTWGIAAPLARKLDRRLDLARRRIGAIQRQLVRRGGEVRGLDRDLRTAQNARNAAQRNLASLREHPEIDLCAPQGVLDAILDAIDRGIDELFGREHNRYCPTEGDYERAATYWGRRARAVEVRRGRALRREAAAQRRLESAAETHDALLAKARVARLVVARDITCIPRRERVEMRLLIGNDFGFEVRALARAAYSVRGTRGRPIEAASPKLVPVVLGPGEVRELVVEAGPSTANGRPAPIAACSPRLADLALSAYRAPEPVVPVVAVAAPAQFAEPDEYLALPGVGPVQPPEIPLP